MFEAFGSFLLVQSCQCLSSSFSLRGLIGSCANVRSADSTRQTFSPRLLQFRERLNAAMKSLEEGRFARQLQMLYGCVCRGLRSQQLGFFQPFSLVFTKSSSGVPEHMGQWMLMANVLIMIKHTHSVLSFFCNSEPLCLSLPPRYLINPQTFIPDETKIAVTNDTHVVFIR